MRAEIEWAQTRTKIAEEARSLVQQLITVDEPILKKLEEDAQLYCSLSALQKEVDALRAELEGLPSAEEALRIIDESKEAAREEEDLDDQILDLEIEELRLEHEAATLRGKQLREQNAMLKEWADDMERNEARTRTLLREILNFNVAR
ncbi:hypothetical protein COOONC_12433 [Cooperia oncophora]